MIKDVMFYTNFFNKTKSQTIFFSNGTVGDPHLSQTNYNCNGGSSSFNFISILGIISY